MTSDSHSPPRSQIMALLQSCTTEPPQFRAPTTCHANSETSARKPIVAASSMASLPSKKSSERTRLLNPEETTNRSSPTSSSSSTASPNPNDEDPVYPWNYNSSTSMTVSSLNGDVSSYHTYHINIATGPSTMLQSTPEQTQTSPSTFARLLARAQSISASLPLPGAASFNVVGSGTKNGSLPRRHSILRVSSNRSLSDRPLRKSASVEFALHHDALQKLTYADRRESTSNATPRRLTFEEKAELYKVRPDLEVGPTPFFKEQMRELEQRNQRRTLCAIVGGVLCILFLMVVYYLLSFAEGN